MHASLTIWLHRPSEVVQSEVQKSLEQEISKSENSAQPIILAEPELGATPQG